MIALGWCLANQSVPEPLWLSVCGQIAVLCAPADVAQTPRARLGLLQSAFDAGIDLVPLSTIRDWPAEMARDLAVRAATDLQQQITRISGMGQITLQMFRSNETEDVSADPSLRDGGRSWLRHRADSLAAHEALVASSASLLLALARDIDAPASAIQPARHGAKVHFLMPRDSLGDLGGRLSQTRLRPDLLAGAIFSLSGPWPAFDFVETPQMVSA